jgi:hypothetical protein
MEQAVYNELPHRMAMTGHDDMAWLKWILAALVVMWFVEKFGEGDTVRKMVGKVGDKALSKVIDKAVAGF